MAVISCNLSREGQSGQYDIGSGRSFTAQWQVLTNSKDDGPDIVLGTGPVVGPEPIPVIGSLYAIGNDIVGHLFCRHLSAERRQGRVQEWTVTATYGILEPGEEYEDIVSDNPLTRPVHYRLDAEHWTRVVEKDKDGVALKNSAGVPFDNGVELDDSYQVLIAEKNFGALQEIIDLSSQFSMKVNNDVFHGKPPRSWLCRPITSSDIQQENGHTFYRASFSMVQKTDLWDVPILDAGFSELNGGVLRDILDKNKQPITEPWPLNGAGVKLPEGNPLVFLTKRIRGEAAFSGLGI